MEVGYGEVLREPIAEEQTACFYGGADEGRADAAVEGEEAIAGDALFEAIQWASVAERGGCGLGLEANLDGVEWIFDKFAENASDGAEDSVLKRFGALGGVSSWSGEGS